MVQRVDSEKGDSGLPWLRGGGSVRYIISTATSQRYRSTYLPPRRISEPHGHSLPRQSRRVCAAALQSRAGPARTTPTAHSQPPSVCLAGRASEPQSLATVSDAKELSLPARHLPGGRHVEGGAAGESPHRCTVSARSREGGGEKRRPPFPRGGAHFSVPCMALPQVPQATAISSRHEEAAGHDPSSRSIGVPRGCMPGGGSGEGVGHLSARGVAFGR